MAVNVKHFIQGARGPLATRLACWLLTVALTLTMLPATLSEVLADPARQHGQTVKGSGADSGDATAQLQGAAYLSPSSSVVLLGSVSDVDVWIGDTVGLYSIDYRFCFAPTIASVPLTKGILRWEVFDENNHIVIQNKVLDADSGLCPCSAIAGNKFYHYAVSNWLPAGPFTGSGRFATLTFLANSIGTTPLRFCYLLAGDKDGNPIAVTTADGSITVVYGRLGNMVWDDLDKDGIQDSGEPGVPNVTVRLLNGSGNPVLDPGGNPITTQTATDGSFELTNMPAGTYIVEFVKPANYVFTAYNSDGQGLNGTANSDADRTSGRTVAFTLSSPAPQVHIDAGLIAVPTVASVHDVRAYVDEGRVVVGWETAVEVGTLGFDLQRFDETTGEYTTVNERLIPAVGSALGASYRVVDPEAKAGSGNSYRIVEVEPSGWSTGYGPFAVKVAGSGDRVTGRYVAEQHAISPEQEARAATASAEAARVRLLRESRQSTQKVNSGGGPEVSLKITVQDAGLYYLSASRIASAMGTSAAQVESWLRSDDLALTNQGHDVAYLIAPNRSGLYFYGQSLDSIYSAENVYWLGQGEGHTMDIVRGKVPKAGDSTGSFAQTIHLEEDHLAIPAAFSDPEADYWMWDTLWAGEPERDHVDYDFSAPGATAGIGSLMLHLLGYSDTPADDDHHVVVALNGHELGQARWDGVNALDLTLAFDATWLMDEGNSVSIRSVLDEGLAYSAFHVDSFDLTYPRRYQASDNLLVLGSDANDLIKVDGFTRQSIWVIDITNPLEPKQVLAVKVLRSGGTYQVLFQPESTGSVYLTMTPDRALTPASVLVDEPSNLKDPTRSADLVIIAPAQFKQGAETLAAYRRTQGLSALVVDLADVYDEFNAGLASPQAIKAFLQYAFEHWQRSPRYALLAGEGNYDYKDNLGLGGNLIPVWMVGTSRGLYAADNRFADVSGEDGVPEMAIGRLPVATTAELDAAVARIMAYERGSGAGWSDQVLLLADNADDGGDFAADSRELEASLPASDSKKIVALGEVPLISAKEQLISALNNGVGLFNYLGHGGLDRLAAEGLLTSQDVSHLDNAQRLPVAALMTCAAGQFAIPGLDSLAEQLVQGAGGAIAVWSPTGWALNADSKHLDEALLQALRGSEQRVLGDAIVAALHNYAASGEDAAVMDLFNLLGDPTLVTK